MIFSVHDSCDGAWNIVGTITGREMTSRSRTTEQSIGATAADTGIRTLDDLTLYFNMGAPHYATTLTNPHLRPWHNAAAATIVFHLGISPTHRAIKLVLGKGREFLKTVSIDQLIVQLPARDIG